MAEEEKERREEKHSKRDSYLSLSSMTMPVEEKTQMIIELKAKISQLYKELKEGEENMLLLTKKYDMMKRNMKTYKLDVANKIGQLREQLQDKEEELRDLEKNTGKTSHRREDADKGPEGLDDDELDELRIQICYLQEQLEKKEEEIRILMAGTKFNPHADNDSDELEKLLLNVQQKLVRVSQQLMEKEVETETLRRRFSDKQEQMSSLLCRQRHVRFLDRTLHSWNSLIVSGDFSSNGHLLADASDQEKKSESASTSSRDGLLIWKHKVPSDLTKTLPA
mmetsp:Transcript_11478/g.26235  ORF Transcript_11478/g.26235 Transcript_11478/m.26235 type:complete len:280 (+) Transcript_11478:1495-2334(+)